MSRLSTMTYPDNSVITYTYNGPFADQVKEGSTVYAQYHNYNALGQPVSTNFSNGVTTYFTYEANTFRLKSLQTTKSSTTMQNLEYAYDHVGNVQSITDYLTAANSQTFTYDDLNRLLTGNSMAYGTITYAYNQIGNMTSNSALDPSTYSYPASGSSSVRPHAVTTAGPNSYTYDANGNMLTGAGRTFNSYDFENRPTSITSGGQTTTFTYDGDGGRVKKQTGSTVTWYISKLYECDGASCTKMIFSGSQRIVAKPVGSASLYFYHGDHLGSTSVVTDSTGTQVQALTYYPFGQTRTNVPGSPVNVAHKYTGKELDNATVKGHPNLPSSGHRKFPTRVRLSPPFPPPGQAPL
jgi:YD repeat-containing protein